MGTSRQVGTCTLWTPLIRHDLLGGSDPSHHQVAVPTSTTWGISPFPPQHCPRCWDNPLPSVCPRKDWIPGLGQSPPQPLWPGGSWQQREPGAPEDDAHWEHPCILLRAGEGFSGPFSIREPAGIPAEAGAGGLDGYQRQTPSANAFVAALNSLRCLCWRSRLGGGRVFLHLGAGETSPSMIFHLTSPCHICQLLLITEFAITLRTDVKGRKKRKRRLRDSTIINDVWQAKVPYNAL